MTVSLEAAALLDRCGVPAGPLAAGRGRAGGLVARSPLTGEAVAELAVPTPGEAAAQVERAHAAYLAWRMVPAPRRGELVRLLGDELRAARADLGRLVTLEAGKIVSEGLGEVQEMIDICDFATGLSRQLHGLTIATERPQHRMMETWHPLGVGRPVARNADRHAVAGTACQTSGSRSVKASTTTVGSAARAASIATASTLAATARSASNVSGGTRPLTSASWSTCGHNGWLGFFAISSTSNCQARSRSSSFRMVSTAYSRLVASSNGTSPRTLTYRGAAAIRSPAHAVASHAPGVCPANGNRQPWRSSPESFHSCGKANSGSASGSANGLNSTRIPSGARPSVQYSRAASQSPEADSGDDSVSAIPCWGWDKSGSTSRAGASAIGASGAPASLLGAIVAGVSDACGEAFGSSLTHRLFGVHTTRSDRVETPSPRNRTVTIARVPLSVLANDARIHGAMSSSGIVKGMPPSAGHNARSSPS